MPINPAIVVAGAGLLGQAINAGSNANINKKTREWNERMYNLQRTHSLSDWTMQNEYNSPQAQMARLKSAGLNPNLIYGEGSVVGNSSSNIRSADVKSWNPQAPQLDLGQVASAGLGSYYDWEIKKAQTDNLKAQNTVILQEALLKAAQTYSTAASGDKTSIEASYAKDNYLTSLEAAKANLDKTIATTKVMLDENERRAAMQAPNLRIAAEKVLLMRMQRTKDAEQIKLIQQHLKVLEKDETLKQLDIELKQKGIQPGDNMFMRILARYLGEGAFSTEGITEGLIKKYEAWKNAPK